MTRLDACPLAGQVKKIDPLAVAAKNPTGPLPPCVAGERDSAPHAIRARLQMQLGGRRANLIHLPDKPAGVALMWLFQLAYESHSPAGMNRQGSQFAMANLQFSIPLSQ
jgi:hypothetical protein